MSLRLCQTLPVSCSEELTGQGVGAKMERALDARGYGLVVTGHSLGAGTAALISLKLKERFPGKSAPHSCACVVRI